jgi:NAD(P)-dependent dehydrogenase (short-subunit alcohol dehydrogenase family)
MTTTRVTSPFGFESTAAEVIADIDLHDRRALVTGAASGIGVETARALASAGAETVIAARDLAAAERTAADIRATTGNPAVSVARLDLLDRGSVDELVRDLAGPLHILVNNAGVMAIPDLRRSPEGHELQFATNHLGHFRLALGLLPALRAAGGARVVSVSSRAHLNSPVIFDDIDFRDRPYDPALAYAQSKTANVLFAVEATRRWAADGIAVNALNPGAVPTNLQRHTGGRLLSPPELHKTVAQGAATSVLLATSPALAGIGGRYFNDGQEAVVVDRRPDTVADMTRAVAAYAVDRDNAKRLWELSQAAL